LYKLKISTKKFSFSERDDRGKFKNVLSSLDLETVLQFNISCTYICTGVERGIFGEKA
jgi:hypothetical protein